MAMYKALCLLLILVAPAAAVQKNSFLASPARKAAFQWQTAEKRLLGSISQLGKALRNQIGHKGAIDATQLNELGAKAREVLMREAQKLPAKHDAEIIGNYAKWAPYVVLLSVYPRQDNLDFDEEEDDSDDSEDDSDDSQDDFQGDSGGVESEEEDFSGPCAGEDGGVCPHGENSSPNPITAVSNMANTMNALSKPGNGDAQVKNVLGSIFSNAFKTQATSPWLDEKNDLFVHPEDGESNLGRALKAQYEDILKGIIGKDSTNMGKAMGVSNDGGAGFNMDAIQSMFGLAGDAGNTKGKSSSHVGDLGQQLAQNILGSDSGGKSDAGGKGKGAIVGKVEEDAKKDAGKLAKQIDKDVEKREAQATKDGSKEAAGKDETAKKDTQAKKDDKKEDKQSDKDAKTDVKQEGDVKADEASAGVDPKDVKAKLETDLKDKDNLVRGEAGLVVGNGDEATDKAKTEKALKDKEAKDEKVDAAAGGHGDPAEKDAHKDVKQMEKE